MQKTRIIKDCIYNHIEIPELCAKFIDTPEFQRLRRVKQLGVAHYVYPSAVHTRFEHSIGVMHLAGKMVDQLNKIGAQISPRAKECVQLSALQHDQGHMALSHLSDRVMDSKHEERSIAIFKTVAKRLGALTAQEEDFVVNAIMGNVPENSKTPYLYQIVCNKKCGIDVDKMDYMAKDVYHCGFPGFQSDYILLNVRIKDGNIAFREKVKGDIADLFRTRATLHKTVYQHKVCRKIDKLYFCMMKRLGQDQHLLADDAILETHLRAQFPEMMLKIDTRDLSHDCEVCRHFSVEVIVPSGGSIDEVEFV